MDGWKEEAWKIGEFGFNELIISERSVGIVTGKKGIKQLWKRFDLYMI